MDKVDDAEEDGNSDKENEGKNSEPKVSTEGMTWRQLVILLWGGMEEITSWVDFNIFSSSI